MSNTATVTFTTQKTTSDLNGLFANSNPNLMMTYFQNYLAGLVSGSAGAILTVKINSGDAVQASGTVTVANPVSGDALEVNGVSFTAGSDFTIGGTDAATATNLAAAINASSDPLITGYVTASADDEVVTVTAASYGTAGNTITLEGKGSGGIDADGSGDHATGTLTLASAASGDTAVINGTTLTAVDKKEKTQVQTIAELGRGEATDITCVGDTAGSLNNTYFTYVTRNSGGASTNSRYVWYNVDAGGVDPAPGGTGIAVAIAADSDASAVASATRTALAADTKVTITGATSHVIITNNYMGTATDTANGAGGGSPGFSYSKTDGVASTLLNKYFVFYNAGDATKYYMWYNVNGEGTDPAVASATGIQVNINALDNANTVATNSRAKFALSPLSTYFTESGATDKIVFRNVTTGSTTDTADTGSTGFTITKLVNGAAVGSTEFQIGSTDAADATSLAALINAQSSTLAPIVVGTSALGVVTVTAREEGVQGNDITLAATGNITAGDTRLSGGADSGVTRLSGGTEDTGSISYDFS